MPLRRSRTLALLLRSALRRLRHSLSGADAEPVLVQLAARRVRHVPRLRPHDRHRLRARRSGRDRRRSKGGAVRPWQTESYRECQDDLIKLRAQARHAHRCAVARADRSSSGTGCWKARAAGKTRFGTACGASSPGSKPSRTRCTFACCCRSTARTRRARVRRRAPQDRRAVVAARARAPTPSASLRSRERFRPTAVQWSDAALAQLPGVEHPRADAAADRSLSVHSSSAARCRRRSMRRRSRAARDSQPPELPARCRARLSDARSPVAHACRAAKCSAST